MEIIVIRDGIPGLQCGQSLEVTRQTLKAIAAQVKAQTGLELNQWSSTPGLLAAQRLNAWEKEQKNAETL